jgi:hypothetical protein
MTLTDLCTEVATIVNRPDLQDTIIKSHVKAATYSLHAKENWWRDKQEGTLTFDESAFYQSIDHSILPRFRSWSYLRIWDPAGSDPLTSATTGAAGKFFAVTTDPESLFDSYGNPKKYTAVAVGGRTNLRSTEQFSVIIVSWYQNPIVTPDGSYSSWIADVSPFAIIYVAASLMYAGINQQDQARKWEKMAMEQVAILTTGNLTPRGY